MTVKQKVNSTKNVDSSGSVKRIQDFYEANPQLNFIKRIKKLTNNLNIF